MKRKFEVTVSTMVIVEIDDEIINGEFNEEFSRYFWEVDDVEDHARYLAEMKATGRIFSDDFVEGYGTLSDAGIEVTEEDVWIDNIDEV